MVNVPNVADAIVVFLDAARCSIDGPLDFSFFRHKSDETEAPTLLAHEWRLPHSRMMCENFEHVWSLESKARRKISVGCGVVGLFGVCCKVNH